MGSLAGHVVPGAFFIIYGVLLCLNFIWYHLKSKSRHRSSGDLRSRKDKLSHSSSSSSFFEFKRDHDLSKKSWIPLSFTRIPVEPLLKILFPSLGLLVEVFFDYVWDSNGKHLVFKVYSVWGDDGELNGISKLHHITMYSAFILSGIMDVLTLCVKLPRQTSILFFSLAFTIEGLLFYLHTFGREALNMEVHSLLTYAIFAGAIFSLLRLFVTTNLVVNLGLGSSVLLQGTWFVHAGVLLFGNVLPPHDEKTNEDAYHEEVMFIVACFAWHLFLISLYNVVAWIVLSACSKSPLRHRRTRASRRRGLLANLQQGWQGQSAGCEERNNLMVQEEGEEKEDVESPNKEIEMRFMAETHT